VRTEEGGWQRRAAGDFTRGGSPLVGGGLIGRGFWLFSLSRSLAEELPGPAGAEADY
jgi:hypothetical protein